MARNRRLVYSHGLDRLKFEVASELVPQIRQAPGAQAASIPPAFPGQGDVAAYDRLKFEIAQELGVPYQPGYNGHLPARDAGRLGGKIGGNMVRRLITIAEQALAGPLPPQ